MFPNKVPGTAALLEFKLTFETCTNLQFAADFTLTYGFLHGCSSLQCERLSRIRLTGKPLSAIIFTEFKFEEFRHLSVEKITAVSSCSDSLLSYLFGNQWQLPVNMSWMISKPGPIVPMKLPALVGASPAMSLGSLIHHGVQSGRFK